MTTRALLEVIALDAEDAVAAQAGGADRLELVSEKVDLAAPVFTDQMTTLASKAAASRRSAPVFWGISGS